MERYEICCAADYDPAIRPDQRQACWNGWLSGHSTAQPPERIRHAETRLRELSLDGSTLPLPSAAPEPVAKREQRYPRKPPTTYPTSSCDPLCNDRWAACNGYCELRDKSCAAACESEYRVCVGGCP